MPAVTATYQLPVHITKYLTSNLGNPYTLRVDDHLFSRYMLRTLTGKTIKSAHRAPESSKKAPFSIIIPPGLNEKNYLWNISEESEKDFILEAEKIFETALFAYIAGVLDLKNQFKLSTDKHLASNIKLINIKNAVVNFCDRYDISENDITTDALIKRYYRTNGSTLFFKKDKSVEPTDVS